MSLFPVLVCIVGWGVWSVAVKKAGQYMSPWMIQLVTMYVYSALAPIIFLLMKSQSISTEWSGKGIAWTTLACLLSVAAGSAFMVALQKSQVHMVLAFTCCYPVLTFVLCWAFLGEDVTLKKLLGITAIAIGTIMIGV